MSRPLQDEFEALCAKLARHADHEVRELVEEAWAARRSEGDLATALMHGIALGISPERARYLIDEWHAQFELEAVGRTQ